MIVWFADEERNDIQLIGGKARSLMDMTKRGRSVPPGFILAVPYFSAWLNQLSGERSWRKAQDAAREQDAPSLTKACDEAVISANFGLGESVVQGIVTPDTMVVGKVSSKLIDMRIGTKSLGIYLRPDGGTEERTMPNPDQRVLQDSQINEITTVLAGIERDSGQPVDIEWAYEGENLYVLQSRPVTAYFQVPEGMETAAEEQRRLHMDFALVGQGIDTPFSPLGIDLFTRTQDVFMKTMMGTDIGGIEDGFFGSAAGRAYANISNILKTPGGSKTALKIARNDRIAEQILAQIDKRSYMSRRTPKKLKGFLFKVLGVSMSYMKKAKKAYADPDSFSAAIIDGEKEFSSYVDGAVADDSTTLSELVTKLNEYTSAFIGFRTLPVTTASNLTALEHIRKLFPSHPEDVNELERGLENNVSIEMGLHLYRMSRYPEFTKYRRGEDFVEDLNQGRIPKELVAEWEGCVQRYGFRCPKELDVATERPAENPIQIFDTVKQMAINEDPENNAAVIFQNARVNREAVYGRLSDMVSGKKREAFAKDYEVWTKLGGYREIHKYFLIYVTYAVRKRVLKIAENLVAEGRLSSIERIFNLTVA